MQNETDVTRKGVTPDGIHWYERNGHRFIDLDHEDNAPRKGTKYILPINGDKFNELTMRAFRDHNYGIWFGRPVGFDKDGMPKFNKIKILAARYYDLSVPMDRQEFVVMQHHESVRGSRFNSGKAFLRIEDPEQIATKKADTIVEGVEAIQLGAQLNGKKLKDFARFLGVKVGNNSERIILGGVLEIAQKNPAEFMRRWNDERRHIYEVLHRAIELGVVTENLSKGYLYKNSIPIGNTIALAVEKLKEDREFLANIDMETEDILAQSLAPSVQKENATVSMTSAEKQLQKMQEENALLREKLTMANNIGAQESESNEPEVPQEPKEKTIPMYEGRPVTGDRNDPNVWTKKELLDVADGFGLDEGAYKKIISKADLVAYINEHRPKMQQPSEADYDGQYSEDTF